MKGLILKDFYTMAPTIKTYTVIIVIYVLAFGIMDNNPSTAVIMSTIVTSMAPLTAIAYDEQSSWDKMARTMPVTAKKIVLSKYLFSIVVSVVTALFSTIIIRIVDKHSFEYYRVTDTTLIAILLAIIFHSMLLPVIYKFGTTKGRIYTILIMMIPAILTGILSFVGFSISAIIIILTEYENLCIAIVMLLIILLLAGSIELSARIYKNKDL